MITQSQPTADVYYPWLDPLRGFAALSVLGAHLVAIAGTPIPDWYPLAWFRVGFLGVDLFFAISGAVILLSLSGLEPRFGPAYRRVFLWRRVARIVPLYLVTCVLYVALVDPTIVERDDAVTVILAHLGFVQNLFLATHGAINGPSWTLAVEMQFYVLVTILGTRLLRMSAGALLLWGLAIALAWRAGVWFVLAADGASADSQRMFVYSTQLPGVLDEFVAGMVAARWVLARAAAGAAISMRRVLGIGFAAVLAWCMAIALMHHQMAGYWTDPLPVIGLRCLFALAAGLSVAAALAAPAARAPRLRFLGDISYGVYLWHMGVLLALRAIWPDAPAWPFAVAVVLLTALLATAGWRFIERPLIAAMRRRTARLMIHHGVGGSGQA